MSVVDYVALAALATCVVILAFCQLRFERELRYVTADTKRIRADLERDITFIEDYFDRCGVRPVGPRVHCGTTWCTRPEGHAGDCK